MIKKFVHWWYFTFRNPVIRKGEKGGFKWKFRRFTLEIRTLSGNWKAKWTASEHPYATLLTSASDENIEGYASIIYEIGALLTTDQKFVNDITTAIRQYSDRIEQGVEVKEDEEEERQALEEVKKVQEYAEMNKKESKKAEKKLDKKLKKVLKK